MSSISLIIDSHKKCVNSKGYTILNSNYFSLKKMCVCYWNMDKYLYKTLMEQIL